MERVEDISDTRSDSARRYATASDASKEVHAEFNEWTGFLTARSVEMAFGILAANWAVYGSADAILSNGYAKSSVALVIVFFGLNLLLTCFMGYLHGRQVKHIDDNTARWTKEFERAADGPSPWPYTRNIERTGSALRFLKTWLPFIAGSLFVIGLIVS
jgi:hypothetical protein